MSKMWHRNSCSGMSYRPCTYFCKCTAYYIHPEYHEADKRLYVITVKRRVSTASGYAEPLDTKLLCQYSRQCEFRNYQMVRRYSKNKTVGNKYAKGH